MDRRQTNRAMPENGRTIVTLNSIKNAAAMVDSVATSLERRDSNDLKLLKARRDQIL